MRHMRRCLSQNGDCIYQFWEIQFLFHEECDSVFRQARRAILLLTCGLDIFLDYSLLGINFKATPFTQCLLPVVSRGPSLKTWPKWPPQFAQCSSKMVEPKDFCVLKATFPLISRLKLGQPVPLSNL